MRSDTSFVVRRAVRLGLVLVLAAGLGACGGRPVPVEVTEPWTSGDERALGIEEEPAAPSDAGPAEGQGDARP